MIKPVPVSESEFNLMRLVTRPTPEQILSLSQFLMYTDMSLVQISRAVARAFSTDELRELRAYMSAEILDRGSGDD